MKRNSIQMAMLVLMGLAFLLIWGSGPSLAYADSSLTLSLTNPKASTTTEVKGEEIGKDETIVIKLTGSGYAETESASQLDSKPQTFSDPTNPGHAPGHPKQSALTPLFFGLLGAVTVIIVMLVAIKIYVRRSPTNPNQISATEE